MSRELSVDLPAYHRLLDELKGKSALCTHSAQKSPGRKGSSTCKIRLKGTHSLDFNEPRCRGDLQTRSATCRNASVGSDSLLLRRTDPEAHRIRVGRGGIPRFADSRLCGLKSSLKAFRFWIHLKAITPYVSCPARKFPPRFSHQNCESKSKACRKDQSTGRETERQLHRGL